MAKEVLAEANGAQRGPRPSAILGSPADDGFEPTKKVGIHDELTYRELDSDWDAQRTDVSRNHADRGWGLHGRYRVRRGVTTGRTRVSAGPPAVARGTSGAATDAGHGLA